MLNVIPVRVQVPNTVTVVVPIEVPFLYTVITVPGASVEVPFTAVEVLVYDPVITGTSEVPLIEETTVTEFETADKPLVPTTIALAVTTSPATRFKPVAVHEVETAAATVVLSSPFTYKYILALLIRVPETWVSVFRSGELVITGGVVALKLICCNSEAFDSQPPVIIAVAQ